MVTDRALDNNVLVAPCPWVVARRLISEAAFMALTGELPSLICKFATVACPDADDEAVPAVLAFKVNTALAPVAIREDAPSARLLVARFPLAIADDVFASTTTVLLLTMPFGASTPARAPMKASLVTASVVVALVRTCWFSTAAVPLTELTPLAWATPPAVEVTLPRLFEATLPLASEVAWLPATLRLALPFITSTEPLMAAALFRLPTKALELFWLLTSSKSACTLATNGLVPLLFIEAVSLLVLTGVV